MSITIVSAPSQAAQTSAPEAANEVAAGQDFANLLLGQLAVSTPPPPIVSAAETPAADATDAASAAPGDAAALLAALGLAAPQAKTDSTLASGGQSDKTTDARLSALPTAPAASLKAPAPADPLQAEAVPTAALGADDKAAKFAVSALGAPVEESAIIKSLTADAPATASPVPTHSSAGNVTSHRDTSLALPTPVRDQNWASDFSQKIVWLASNDKQSAQLTLNPPQMGPIEISLNVDKGNNASVSFASANAEVRDAIETALPRLREMFASAGISLGQTNVGSESFSQQQAANGERNPSSSRWTNDNAILGAETAGAHQARAFGTQQGSGMVDIFA